MLDMIVNFKKMDKWAIAPTYGSEEAAGCDLHADLHGDHEIVVRAGETVKIGTGICIELPYGFFGAVFARSGIATKKGLRPANCVGVIDSDYRGEIVVALHNDSHDDRVVQNGDRIAQLVVMPCLIVEMHEVPELSNTERGTGGFGHTGR